ncbi:MAG TPA: hypothetical protein VFK13_05235 [Gemmatimonadaceae bacterium]|nr:hypothetical protein [Gemmatimonadaceae bacterium]
MTNGSHWLDPVRRALDTAPHPVRVFFRDDDAGWDDAALFRLLARFRAYDAPIDLAVIPCALTAPLARRLRRAAEASHGRIGMHQHGYAHANHEVTGRKCEFGASRSAHVQRADIAAGRAILDDLLGAHAERIFTPPWNRCTHETAACLTDLGFRALSRDVTAAPLPPFGLAELRVAVNWLTGPRGVRVSHGEQGDTLAAAIDAAAASGDPVGIMLHHAVMDHVALGAIGELLRLFAAHSNVRWSRMQLILAPEVRHAPTVRPASAVYASAETWMSGRDV